MKSAPRCVVGKEQFAKKLREKAKLEKAEAKRERREQRAELGSADEVERPPEATVLAALAALHGEFAAGRVSFEDYEQRKHDLALQLDV